MTSLLIGIQAENDKNLHVSQSHDPEVMKSLHENSDQCLLYRRCCCCVLNFQYKDEK